MSGGESVSSQPLFAPDTVVSAQETVGRGKVD